MYSPLFVALSIGSSEFIHSFVTEIYIAPLQGYYSEEQFRHYCISSFVHTFLSEFFPMAIADIHTA